MLFHLLARVVSQNYYRMPVVSIYYETAFDTSLHPVRVEDSKPPFLNSLSVLPILQSV